MESSSLGLLMADRGKRKIFVSATTRGLGSFRRALVEALEAKGFEVVVQEYLKLDYEDVPRMLRSAISPCDAVLCLVGPAFGAEPENRPKHAPRRSYTQLEYDMATALRKPAFVFLASKDCPLDPYAEEPPELRELQRAFSDGLRHRRLAQHTQRQLFYEFSSCDALLAMVRDRFPDAADVPNWTGKPCNLPQVSLGQLFKGRDDFVAKLRATLLARPEAAALIVAQQVIHGLGGGGKTRLAIEYAWRFAAEYTALLFVSANTPEDLHRTLASLVKPKPHGLDLPEQEVTEEAVQVAGVLCWLRTNPGWLLILDNVDTQEGAAATEQLLSHLIHGHVLVTSRISQWGTGLETLELNVLDNGPAKEFLLSRTAGKRKAHADDETAADELAHELGGLALALEQAGAYVVYHHCCLSGYLTEWRKHAARPQAWFDERLMKYPRSLAATWETTVAQLPPPARALLRLLAQLAPDPIPAGLLRTHTAGEILADAAAALSGERNEGAADPLTALANLAAYSLVRWEADGSPAGRDAFTMHRLVQEVTRERTPQEERRDWIQRTLLLVDAYGPDPEDVRTWRVWDALQPHVAEIVLRGDGARIAHPTSLLMNQLGVLLSWKGMWAEAEPLKRRALAIDERSYGPNHPIVALLLNNLARLLHKTNRTAEAEPLMRRRWQSTSSGTDPITLVWQST